MALPEAPPWWYLFDVTEQKLVLVAKEIQGLYTLPKPEYTRLTLAAPLHGNTIAPARVEDNEEEVRGGGGDTRPRTKRRAWDK